MSRQPFGHIACVVEGTATGRAALAASLALWREGDGRLSLLQAAGPGETRDPERMRRDWVLGRGRAMPGAEPVFLPDAGAAGICGWARGAAPDVIVAGAGAGRPPGMGAGGLVDDLLERAPCAVMVVVGDAPASAAEGDPPFAHVACCLDGAPADADALAAARALAGDAGRLSVVHVAVGSGRVSVDDVARSVPGAEPVLLGGVPGPAICRWAREAPADLLVLASRHPGRWGMSVLGPTIRQVVDDAPCSVLVARHEET